MVPLRIIEDPYFILLFDKLKVSRQGLTIMSRRSLSRQINSLFESQNTDQTRIADDFVCMHYCRHLVRKKKKFSAH